LIKFRSSRRRKSSSLRRWLREYEAELWDQQIEAGIRSGKLDKLGQEALEELRAGKTRPFPE